MNAAGRARISDANRTPKVKRIYGYAASNSSIAVRYTDVGRTRFVLQNPAGSPGTVTLGFGTVGSFNAPGSLPTSIPPGQQYRDENPSTAPIWINIVGQNYSGIPYYVEIAKP